jgi:Holliday junction DNA helicase RuvA
MPLTRANGVGPKLAGRIVAELKDKVGETSLSVRPLAGIGVAANDALNRDAISALVNLGYRQTEAFNAVTQASRALGPTASLESLIKAGLKELAI